MQTRCFLYGSLALLSACAHRPAAQVSADRAPVPATPSKESIAEARRLEISEAFDPVFAKTPKLVDQSPNGLRIEDYQLGEGELAQVGSQLTLRFVGYLDDGTVFDQNADASMPPFRFALPQKPKVQGWGLGLRGMRAGGVRKIVVPPGLAYGEEGDPADEDVPAIPPNSTLTYLVKLMEVKPPLASPEPATSFEKKVLQRDARPGGLVAEDIKLGFGEAAQPGDKARFYFRGLLQDGTNVTAKDGRAKPMEIVIGDEKNIEGWNQGMVGMKVGGLRRLRVPAKLAFGDEGEGPIPPRANVIFLIQLVELIKP